MDFDRKLEFQFGFFLNSSQGTIEKDGILALPRFFEPKTRFGDVRIEETILPHHGQMLQVPTISWGAGVWRMVWSPLRLDVYADAVQYLSVADRPLSLDAARQRLAPGLTRAAEHIATLGFTVHRLVAVVTAEAAEDVSKTAALERIADRYYGDTIRRAVRERQVIDLGTRIDHGGSFELPGGTTPVHRIENVGTTINFSGASPVLTTHVVLDVNTSPVRGVTAVPLEAFDPFFGAACTWMSERLAGLET